MKHILFPTDFSEAASAAFPYALFLADQWSADITTVHIYQPADRAVATHMPITMQRIYETIELEEFENYRDSIPPLRELAESAGYGHVSLQHVMRKGERIVPAILDQMRQERSDFVVMGTTGARGLREVFLGSVAGEIMERAACPVLAIPEKASFRGRLDHILFTTSYAEEEKRALKRLLDFAGVLGAGVHVINIDTTHTEFYHHRMSKLQEEYADNPGLTFEVIDKVDIMEGITAYLAKYTVDMLAMVTHKRSFFKELFNYSKAKTLSYHTDTPILSLPADIL